VTPIVVTRRVVQACARVNEAGVLSPVPTPVSPFPPIQPLPPALVTNEAVLERLQRTTLRQLVEPGAGVKQSRIAAVNELNAYQRQIAAALLSGFSAGAYQQRPFVQTNAFRLLTVATLSKLPLDLDRLLQLNHLTSEQLQHLRASNISMIK
jgi:hypothetical protein